MAQGLAIQASWILITWGGGTLHAEARPGTLPGRWRLRRNSPRSKTSGLHCWQGCANAPGEIWNIIGSQRDVVDPRTPAQFFKRQCPVHQARAVQIAIDEAVEEMLDVKLADSAGNVRVAHDVDCATVAQQMVKLCVISEFIDPIQID